MISIKINLLFKNYKLANILNKIGTKNKQNYNIDF